MVLRGPRAAVRPAALIAAWRGGVARIGAAHEMNREKFPCFPSTTRFISHAADCLLHCTLADL